MTPAQVKQAASLLSQIDALGDRRLRLADDLGGDGAYLFVRPEGKSGLMLSLDESRAVVAALVAHCDQLISKARADLAALGVRGLEGGQGNG